MSSGQNFPWADLQRFLNLQNLQRFLNQQELQQLDQMQELQRFLHLHDLQKFLSEDLQRGMMVIRFTVIKVRIMIKVVADYHDDQWADKNQIAGIKRLKNNGDNHNCQKVVQYQPRFLHRMASKRGCWWGDPPCSNLSLYICCYKLFSQSS